MLFDNEFLNKFDNEFTDQQRQITLIGIKSQIQLKTYDEYLEFLKDPRSFLFTKGGDWVGTKIVDEILKAYNNRLIRENPFNEKYLQDIIYVNNVITENLTLPGFYKDDNSSIEELFLLEYEKNYSDKVLPDVDLNRRFIKRFKDTQHYTWQFPRTKCFKENTIRRMYVTDELYLDEHDFLKDYYNSLKKHNEDLKNDTIKLANAINKRNSKEKVTLYNCKKPISKEIWKYPLADIVNHIYDINWGKAFNDPKLEEYFINEFENKEIDKNIYYIQFYNVFTSELIMENNAEIGRRVINLSGFKSKYFDSLVRQYIRNFKSDHFVDICRYYTLVNKDNIDVMLDKFIEYFPYMEESRSSLRNIFDYCEEQVLTRFSYELKKEFYKDEKNSESFDLTDADEFAEFIKYYNEKKQKNG